MEHRNSSSSRSFLPYPQQPFYNGDSQRSQFDLSQQNYTQYTGSESQQHPNPSYYALDWNQPFNSQFPSSQNAFPQTLQNQSAANPEFDLERISADPQSVEDIDVDSFTKPAAQEWRPPVFSNFGDVAPGYSCAEYGKSNGVVSEPLPNQPGAINTGSDDTSVADSAYMTNQQSTDIASWSSYGFEAVGSPHASTNSVNNLLQPSPARRRPFTGKSLSGRRKRKFPDNKGRRLSGILPPCPICGYDPKNQSDSLKHSNRHLKPYKCTLPGCDVNGVGFATSNDLDRHHKSGKHNLAPTKGSSKGYICAACPTAPENKLKWWPRLDNFKAHISRKHKGMDSKFLIAKSERETRPADSIDDNSTYFSGPSLGDQDFYQQEDLTSPTGTVQLPQGESILWSDHAALLPPIDELFSIGEAHHLTDQFPDRRPGASDTHVGRAAGPSLLGAAAEMSSPSMLQLVEPDERVKLYGDECSQKSSKHERDKNNSQWQHNIEASQNHMDLSEDEGPVQCKYCGKEKKRRCDLRKHMKRHTRPYGCTFPRCYVRHGSRSDWKRHEGNQHRVPESWKCTLTATSGLACHANFYSCRKLVSHLSAVHNIFQEHITRELCEDMHLGKDGHNQFWCGFCRTIVPNKPDSNKTARESRLDHIGGHFDKDDKHIRDYECLDLQKLLGDLTEEEKKRAKDNYNCSLPAEPDGFDIVEGFGAIQGCELDLPEPYEVEQLFRLTRRDS